MRTSFIVLLPLLLFNNAISQEFIEINFNTIDIDFEDSEFYKYILIDTNNIWKIGTPNKELIFPEPQHIFGEKSIYSDTNLYYGKDISSYFQFKIIIGNADFYGIGFDQKYDFENGKDGGTIEVSWDNGITWNNLINDPVIQQYFELDNFYSETDTIEALRGTRVLQVNLTVLMEVACTGIENHH